MCSDFISKAIALHSNPASKASGQLKLKSAGRVKTLDNRACNACLVAIALAQTKLALGLLWCHAIGSFGEKQFNLRSTS
jgi:hypothetical protein